MGDKKRKALPLGSEMPISKSRKRAADYLGGDEADIAAPAAKLANGNDEEAETEPLETKKKKNKKSKKNKEEGEALTADGVNGVVEHVGHEEVEVTPSSMQAEAQRTVDDEIEEQFEVGQDVGNAEDGDLGPALLAGFDSDTSDHAEDKGLDVSNLGSIPNYKKTKKKLRKIENNGDAATPGAIYVGRVPHGFYEPQMREYFSQFGDITRLRLSRNKRTGASKHFAFIEFKSEEVAKIVAETMDNYLMFGHILKCKFAPPESLHPDVWKGANKKYRKIPHEKLEKARLEAPKSADKWRQKNEKEEKKREKKSKELKEKMGYESPSVKLTDPVKALEANKLEASKPKEIKDAVADEASAAATIEAPRDPTAEASKNEVTESPTDIAIEPTLQAVVNEEGATFADASASKKDKKSKKEKKVKHGKKDKKEQTATQDDPAEQPVAAVTEAEKETVETSIKVPRADAAGTGNDWEDDSDSSAEVLDTEPKDKIEPAKKKKVPQVKTKNGPRIADVLPGYKKPKIPKDATGKQIHRDANGKYVPPMQRKQLALAKFAKENPEAHKAAKKVKVSVRKQKRTEKKDKRHQKMIEKYGAKNVKGGSNYKSSKKKEKSNIGGENE